MHSYFSRYCLYPIYEAFTGRRILEKLRFLEKSQWWDNEKIKIYQLEKIKALLHHAFNHNSYYRNKLNEIGIHPKDIQDFKDFENIPVTRKDDILENFPAFISENYRSSHLNKSVTGGSTGKNLPFFIDKRSFDFMSAAVLRNRMWYNLDFGGTRVILWGSPLVTSKVQKTTAGLRHILLREYYVSTYQLEKSTLAMTAEKIRNIKPKAVVGYVSALNILAEFLEENNIQDVEVPAIIPGAETLFAHQRKYFEKMFHGEVFNRYGSREFYGIAHECNMHAGMHINGENIYLEILKAGQPVSAGELGEIIITDLHNFGMPFIRYCMEDLGALREGSCQCGRGLPLLDHLEGRVYDVIRCPNGSMHTGTFFSNLTRTVSGIKQFQVIQEAQETIKFKIVADTHFSPNSFNFLTEKIKQYCGATMKVDFEVVKTIEPLKSGKHRYIISYKSADKVISR